MDQLKELDARMELALEAARQAHDLILSFYQSSSLVVDRKRDSSPVTEADRGAERLIRELINREYALDGILGEEYGEQPGNSGFRWILDPIDGTKSFIHGVPLFGTLIGIEYQNECVGGVCRFPALDEVVYARKGSGTYWKRGPNPPIQAHVSRVSEIADALFCITTIQGFERIGRKDALDALVATSGLTRGWGDCYGHCLVATGRAEVMVDPLMNLWDAAALLPIVEESGGTFTDWGGNRTAAGGNGVSVNETLSTTVLAHLKP